MKNAPFSTVLAMTALGLAVVACGSGSSTAAPTTVRVASTTVAASGAATTTSAKGGATPTTASGAAAGTTVIKDLCNVLPKADVEKAIGYTVANIATRVVGNYSVCTYENSVNLNGNFVIRVSGSVNDKTAWDSMAKTLDYVKGKAISGVGDGAYSELQTASSYAVVHVWIAKFKAEADFGYDGGVGTKPTDATVTALVGLAKSVVDKAA